MRDRDYCYKEQAFFPIEEFEDHPELGRIHTKPMPHLVTGDDPDPGGGGLPGAGMPRQIARDGSTGAGSRRRRTDGDWPGADGVENPEDDPEGAGAARRNEEEADLIETDKEPRRRVEFDEPLPGPRTVGRRE